MSTVVADNWRDAIRRRLQFLGIGLGQAVERLSSVGGDTRWLKLFMNETTDGITRVYMEDLVLAFTPNWNARGQRFSRESLQYFSEDELLSIFSIDPKCPEY